MVGSVLLAVESTSPAPHSFAAVRIRGNHPAEHPASHTTTNRRNSRGEGVSYGRTLQHAVRRVRPTQCTQIFTSPTDATFFLLVPKSGWVGTQWACTSKAQHHPMIPCCLPVLIWKIRVKIFGHACAHNSISNGPQEV